MKILLATAIFPPEIGGPAKQVWDLAKNLKANDKFTPVVLTFGKENSQIKKSGVKVYRSKSFKKNLSLIGTVFRQVNWMMQLNKVIEKEKIDVVHCHDVRVVGLVTGIVSRLRGLSGLVKYPGDLVYETINKDELKIEEVNEVFEFNLLSRLLSVFQKMVIGMFDKVWVVSKYQKKVLEKQIEVSSEKIIFMPNYFDTKSYKRKKKKGVKPTLLVVGRDVPWKRYEKAYDLIEKMSNRNLVLRVIGKISRSRFEKVRSLEGVKVVMVGKVSPNEMWKEFGKADVLIAFSCYEPFGIIFAEAMATGLPVVAPKTGGIPEVVKDKLTGMLYRKDDWKEAASMLDKLLLDTRHYNSLSKSSVKVARKFDIDSHGREIERFYEKVCGV